MKEVFIISTGLIVKGKTAGSQRVMNIAKSLAAGGVNVFLVSLYQINKSQIDSFELYPGIYHLKSRNNQVKSFLHLLVFLRSMNRFMKERNSETVIYLYPTVFIRKDFAYLLYFKLLKGLKLYCDINELRVTNVFTPNGDVINEFFAIKNIDYFQNSRLEIFNRWGKLIYESNDYKNDWDGANFPSGTYFYIFYPNDPTHKSKIQRSQVTLLR